MPRDNRSPVKPELSKSEYMKGRTCPLALYFSQQAVAKNTPGGKKAADSALERVRAKGEEIHKLAHSVYPDGKEVTAQFFETVQAAQETAQMAADGVPAIFEATAINPDDQTHARIDTLRRVPGTDEWDLVEVKSTASVKPHHIEDLAFQYHVFKGAGYKIRGCYLMHVNGKFVRDGALDPQKFFVTEDLTQKILDRQEDVQEKVAAFNRLIKAKKAPETAIGEKCTAPYPCEYKSKCWKDVPLYSIFNVFYGKEAETVAAQTGSYKIEDVPASLLPAKEAKRIEIEAHKTGKSHVDGPALEKFLKRAEYPLYYLDYETVMDTVPLYDGTRPFQQVPFQFSLHVQEKPDGPIKHYSFLHKKRTDPREAFVKNLVSLLGDKGSVIVYNADFEGDRNSELARDFPEFAPQLKNINSRMIDLYEPFKNRWLYSPKQMGSASIKKVLPAFTDTSYDGLAIGNGEDAFQQYFAFVRGETKGKQAAKLFHDLEAYCGQDTQSMIDLLKAIKEKVAGTVTPRRAGPKPG